MLRLSPLNSEMREYHIWSTRTSNMVKPRVLCAAEWTVKLMCGGKSIFKSTLITFPLIVTEYQLRCCQTTTFFRAAKTKANWQVTLAHGHLKNKQKNAWNHKYMLTDLHLRIGHCMPHIPKISSMFCESNSNKTLTKVLFVTKIHLREKKHQKHQYTYHTLWLVASLKILDWHWNLIDIEIGGAIWFLKKCFGSWNSSLLPSFNLGNQDYFPVVPPVAKVKHLCQHVSKQQSFQKTEAWQHWAQGQACYSLQRRVECQHPDQYPAPWGGLGGSLEYLLVVAETVVSWTDKALEELGGEWLLLPVKRSQTRWLWNLLGMPAGCLPVEALRNYPTCKTEALLEERAWKCPGIPLLEGGLGLFA